MNRLGWRLSWTVVIAIAIWVASGWAGFPMIFRLFFLGYVVPGLLFFLFLDARPRRLPARPIPAIVTFFVVISAILTLAGFVLPQYDPKVEIEKIQRIQKIAVEQEQEKRQKAITEAVEAAKKELLAQMEKEGKTQVAKKAVPGEAAPGTVDAKRVEFGKQVYKDYECYNCHKLGGKGGVKRRGPALDNIGSLVTPEQMKDKILATASWYADGFEKEFKKQTMPDNYPELMSEKEMDALVDYMLTLKDTRVDTPKPIFDVKTE